MWRRLSIGLFAVTLLGQSGPPGCALDRALQAHQAGDLPTALREYQACVAAGADRPEIRSNLGAVLARLGRYQDAIDQYQVAMKAAPPEVVPRLRFNLALAYYKSFQVNEAASELEILHAAQPADLNIALLLADCRLRAGELEKAIELLTPLEAEHQDEPGLNYALGIALIRNGKVADGQVRVDRILGHGESAEGHFLIGSALFASGNYPAAVKEFAKAESMNPELPSLHSYYGQALLFTGDPDGASVEFRRELAANPNDFDANFQLASILAHRGKTEEARPLLERAVLVRPGSGEAREALDHGFRSGPATAEDGIGAGSPAPPVAGLDLTHRARPVVLVFGSYTCPKLRGSAGELKRLSQAYRDRVDFVLVYIREAHADGGTEAEWQSTINQREGIDLRPAANLPEKKEHADFCLRRLDLPWTAIVDGMDAPAEIAYKAWPSRLYLVGRDGRVAYNSRLGELDFRPAVLDDALRHVLEERRPSAARR